MVGASEFGQCIAQLRVECLIPASDIIDKRYYCVEAEILEP